MIDELKDPLDTLVAWQGMSQSQVAAQLASTVGAGATLVTARLDGALAPLTTDLAALAPHLGTAALGTTAAGIVARLGELEAAVGAGDLSGTAATVTALNGHLDDLDAARTAFAADVAPHLAGLQAELTDLAGGIEDSLALVVDALAPSPTLGFLEPLSKLVLDNAAENPVTEFQQWLGTFIAWFQDIVAGLDLSAVKEPLQTAANTAHEALDAFDQAMAGVAATVKGLFNDVEGLVDKVDLSGLVAELEGTLHDFTTQLESQLASLFTPVRDAVHEAVTSIDGAVDQFDPAQIVSVLNDLVSNLEGILSGAADAAKEIGDALQQVTDQIKNVSFAPITDEVIHEIDAVTDSLKAIDTSALTPPLQLALQGALAVLPDDLSPITGPLVDDFDQAVEQSAVPALDVVRGEPQKLLDQVKQFEPTTLIGDALSTPFQQLLQEMNSFKPSSLLDPVKQQLDQLKSRLKENVDPAKALEPLEAPFTELMSAFDSLKPDQIVKPLQDGIDSAVNAVFSAIPVDDVFHQVDEALAKVQDAAAIGDKVVSVLQRVHDVLSIFEGAPAKTTAWLEPILSKVDAAGADASLTAPLAALTTALDGTKAAALAARVDSGIDPVLGPLESVDPHSRLSAIVVAKNAVSRATLNALPDSPEKTAAAAALDRFDPLSTTFMAPFEGLRNLALALSAAKTSAHTLLTDAWDADYTGPDGALGDMVGLTAGPAVGQSVRDIVKSRFADPMNAAFALASPLATGVDAVVTEVKKLVDDLDGKISSLLTGPGSLGDIKNTIEALVDRLHKVNLDFLTTSLDAVFADVRSKVAALDPANLAQALSADFDSLLGQLDLSQALPQTDVDELDADFKKVIDKLAQLDPKKLITDVVQPVFDSDVKPLLDAFDLSKLLDAVVDKLHGLKDELKQELDKVNDSYKQMRAAIPQMSLGDVAGAAAAAAGDLASAVGIGL